MYRSEETTSNNWGPTTNKVMTPNDANFRVRVFNDYTTGVCVAVCRCPYITRELGKPEEFSAAPS